MRELINSLKVGNLDHPATRKLAEHAEEAVARLLQAIDWAVKSEERLDDLCCEAIDAREGWKGVALESLTEEQRQVYNRLAPDNAEEGFANP